MWHMHAPTFNKWHKKKKKKKTLHMLTHGAMRGCGLTSLAVCINDKFRDIRERNVTRRSEIWTTNICSQGFRDIRECVTLWGLILRSLRCTGFSLLNFWRKWIWTFFDLRVIISTKETFICFQTLGFKFYQILACFFFTRLTWTYDGYRDLSMSLH